MIQGDVHVTIVAVMGLKSKKGVDKDADRLLRRILPKLSDQLRAVWACEPR